MSHVKIQRLPSAGRLSPRAERAIAGCTTGFDGLFKGRTDVDARNDGLGHLWVSMDLFMDFPYGLGLKGFSRVPRAVADVFQDFSGPRKGENDALGPGQKTLPQWKHLPHLPREVIE